jgi:hypothetical protein
MSFNYVLSIFKLRETERNFSEQIVSETKRVTLQQKPLRYAYSDLSIKKTEMLTLEATQMS